MKPVFSAIILCAVQVLTPARALVVCADPNNLPFSNRAGAGFENKLVAILARDLHEHIEYLWWAQRRGFVRNTVAQSRCDLWPGVASDVTNMQTSHPYYRSTYVFVTRRQRPLAGLTLDDPRLRTLRIGVQLIGYDATNTPPAQALAARGLTQNIHGYMLFGDYRRPNPPAAIIDDVANDTLDVALVWGPLAGYFAQQAATPLRLEPVVSTGQWRMSYDISVGVRREDARLRQRIDAILELKKPAIDTLLRQYRIPQLSARAP